MNVKGAPVAVWSNGSDSIILYRPYPKEFDYTLFDIPKRGQEPKDVLEAKPYHSWERGLNENTNGLIRQYFPKGMDLRLVSREEIAFVMERLNHRP